MGLKINTTRTKIAILIVPFPLEIEIMSLFVLADVAIQLQHIKSPYMLSFNPCCSGYLPATFYVPQNGTISNEVCLMLLHVCSLPRLKIVYSLFYHGSRLLPRSDVIKKVFHIKNKKFGLMCYLI